MKKVLILAYDFPPYVSVGGLRPYSWYKYFHEFGMYPVAVTRQWGNKYGNKLDYIAPGESNETIYDISDSGTLIKTPYKPNLANKILLRLGENKCKIIRKIISAWYEYMQFLFFIGPKVGLYKGADDYLKKNKVVAIIATGDPFILFKYAARLSARYNVPWIADYRDIWSNDLPMSHKPLLKAWSRYFEKRYLKKATRITMVSEFVKNKTDLELINNKVSIIENGYDHEVLNDTREILQPSDVLTIGYAGSVFKWHPLERFICILNLFVKENPKKNLIVNFYGTNINEHILELVENKYPALQNIVKVYPKMPYNKVIMRMARCNVLLLFNYYSFMGTKIYDYLGLKRFILLCFRNDPVANKLKKQYYTIDENRTDSNQLQADLLNKTKSGLAIEDADDLMEQLNKLYNQFVNEKRIVCNSVSVNEYSRYERIRTLCELIEKVAS